LKNPKRHLYDYFFFVPFLHFAPPKKRRGRKKLLFVWVAGDLEEFIETPQSPPHLNSPYDVLEPLNNMFENMFEHALAPEKGEERGKKKRKGLVDFYLFPAVFGEDV
jgi:hypothetical protein